MYFYKFRYNYFFDLLPRALFKSAINCCFGEITTAQKSKLNYFCTRYRCDIPMLGGLLALDSGSVGGMAPGGMLTRALVGLFFFVALGRIAIDKRGLVRVSNSP
jgi:hypothetical protein